MLANEDLNALKEFCEKSHLPILKELAIEAFDELLALRSLRDAGDDEVKSLANEIQYQLRTVDIFKLSDIAIARGKQLREAREEIERLDQVVQKLKDNFGEMEVGP